MPDTTTTNYGWTKPEDGASEDSWGVKLNANLDEIDTDLKAVSDVADDAAADATAALAAQADPLGPVIALSVAGSSSARTATADLATGSIFDAGTVTFAPAGTPTLTITFTSRPAKSRLVYVLLDASTANADVKASSGTQAWAKPINGNDEVTVDDGDGKCAVAFLILGSDG